METNDGNRIENLLYFDFIPENFNERGRKQDGIEATGTPVRFVDFSLTGRNRQTLFHKWRYKNLNGTRDTCKLDTKRNFKDIKNKWNINRDKLSFLFFKIIFFNNNNFKQMYNKLRKSFDRKSFDWIYLNVFKILF